MKKKRIWIILAIIGGFVTLCCVGILVIGALNSGSKSSVTKSTAIQNSNENKSTDKNEKAVTSVPENTNTPNPTNAPTDAPTDTPEPKSTIGKIGEPMESAGISVTVISLSKEKNLGSLFTADEGNTYLDLEVIITNIDRDEVPYNPMYFKIKDGDGYEYDITMGAKEPDLKSGTLRKGENARGHVAFEVPETAKGFIVSYEPLVLFGGYETVNIDLEKVSENVGDQPETGVSFDDAAKLGERVESGGIAITVQTVKTVKAFTLSTPEKGNVFVDLDVVIENVARDEDPYNPLYFKVKDADGYEYEVSFESLEPSLKSGDLKKGDKVRGHVAFEVPATSTKLLVSYEPMVLFADYKTVRFVIDVPTP